MKPAYSADGTHSGSERGPIHASTACVGEECIVHPGERRRDPDALADGREHLGAGDRLAVRVVRPDVAPLDQREHPGRQVAHVDHLDRIVRRSWREHLATVGDPSRPVREPPGPVVRADDEARAG